MTLKNIKKLSVRLYGKEIGILEDKAGKMRFQYHKDAQTPLSLSLPIREEAYPERICKAYFGGLLPENDSMRKAIAIRYKINPNNDFALLAAIGYDCAGAVSFHKLDEPEVNKLFIPLKGQVVSEAELEHHIKELPVKPYLGRRLSLAGVQEKTPISIINNQIALPSEGSPTTHILKPSLTRYKESVANEYICLKTALSVGLVVPEVEVRTAGNTEFFLIKRFDRLEKDGEIMRLQHEDFTQALGIWTDHKYQVTFKDCLNVLNQMSMPAREKMRFISLVIYNFLIGNCDAHGKNFSVLYMDNGLFLAPVYDVLCTAVYDLDNDMAMKIGRAKYNEDVTVKDWHMFARDLEVAPSLIIEELERQINIVPLALKELVDNMSYEIGHEIKKYVVCNCNDIAKKLKL